MINSLFSSPHQVGLSSVFGLTSLCCLIWSERGAALCNRALKRSGATTIHVQPRWARSFFHSRFSFNCCGEPTCPMQVSNRFLSGCKHHQDPSLSKHAGEKALGTWEKGMQWFGCVEEARWRHESCVVGSLSWLCIAGPSLGTMSCWATMTSSCPRLPSTQDPHPGSSSMNQVSTSCSPEHSIKLLWTSLGQASLTQWDLNAL